MDRLTSMSVFVKVADLGSFASAAEAMRMSPQMVAKHVVMLEDRLGSTLINRTTRRQHLTDIGRAYYDRCRIILAETEDAELLAQQMRSQPRGLLRVTAPITFGNARFAPFVRGYLQTHPEMAIDLSLNDRNVDPLEDGFEVMVRLGEVDDASLIAHPLAPYRQIACASPAYIKRRGAPDTPAQLVDHECLAYAHWSPSMPCRWVFTGNGHRQEVKVSGRFRSNDWKTLLDAAIDGFGIVLGPEPVLAAHIEAGRLVPVLTRYEGPIRPMHVLHLQGRQPTAKVRSFVDAVIAEFGKA